MLSGFWIGWFFSVILYAEHKQSRKIFWLTERCLKFDGRWGYHIHIGKCKAVRKITFLATPSVTPPPPPGHQPEARFSDAITWNSMWKGYSKKLSLGFFILSRKQKWQTCEVSAFFVPLQSDLILDLISCSCKSKSLMVVNLLLFIAEDQDHFEKYLAKRTKWTYGTVLTKNGMFSLKQK